MLPSGVQIAYPHKENRLLEEQAWQSESVEALSECAIDDQAGRKILQVRDQRSIVIRLPGVFVSDRARRPDETVRRVHPSLHPLDHSRKDRNIGMYGLE